MRHHICFTMFISALCLVWATGSSAQAAVSVSGLRCEYTINPLGIEVAHPRLSWVLTSPQRGEMQTAYQVLVASSEEKLKAGEGDLWDSGKVTSGQSTQIPYQGQPLSSRQHCYWKVQMWDKNGEASGYSDPATWEMGLLSPSDWKASWIGFTPGWGGRPLYFRYRFGVKKAVKEAYAYIAGIGYYELHIDGTRVGDHVLDPGWTDYSKRVLYNTYDIGGLIRQGDNVLGVIVGNGWYGMPKLLLQVEITYADGTREQFYSHGGAVDGKTWNVTSGPILSDTIYDGEVYDARLEKPGWDLPGVSLPKPADRTEDWVFSVHPVEPPGGRLVSQMINPIKIMDTLHPEKISEPKPGVFVYDVGQNLAGWAELRVKGERGYASHPAVCGELVPGRNRESGKPSQGGGHGCLRVEGRRRGKVGTPVHLSRIPLRSGGGIPWPTRASEHSGQSGPVLGRRQRRV